MANPFSINVLGGVNIGQEIRSADASSRQIQEQERLAAQRTKMQEALRGAVSGDADSIETLFTLNPQMALKMERRNQERAASQGAAADKVKTEAELDWATQYRQALINDDQEAQQGLIDEAESNPLIEFDQTMIGKDPQQDNLVVNTMLYRGLGKDAYKTLVEGKKPEKGTFTIKETPTGFVRINSATGEVMRIGDQSVAAETERKKEKAAFDQELKSSESTFRRGSNIRNRYDKKIGDFVKVRDSFARIEASATDPSPAGDLALIFNYMKMLDPNSTVRESEFATAENAASVETRILKTYNKVLSGEKLTEGQRKDFVGRSKALMKKADSQQKKDRAEAVRLGKQWGVSEDQLFGAPPQLNSSVLGRVITEQDITDTLNANPGMTRDQVFEQLGIQ